MKSLILLTIITLFSVNLFAQTPEELIERGNQRIKSQDTLFDGFSDLIKAQSDYLNQAQKSMDNKEFALAVEPLNKGLAIKIDFSNAPKAKEFQLLKTANLLNIDSFYRTRAAAYIYLEKWDESIADNSWLINHKAENIGDIYATRGIAYFKKNDHDKALPDLLQAVRLQPKDPVNLRYLGETYLNREEWNQAIAAINKAILLRPKESYFYRLRGFALAKAQRWQKALLDLNTTIRLKPTDSIAYLYRGHVYQALKQPQKALASFKKALELDPSSEEAKEFITELEKK